MSVTGYIQILCMMMLVNLNLKGVTVLYNIMFPDSCGIKAAVNLSL